ncbi:hypothetical protein GCM10010255_83870 [Streptomyces coeruleofuscus]|uniref:ABC transporter permease n=1 Tax=Streptomyces coeruleofuscus TaxID=66879 RepID=A0ABN3JH07_9ACTN
MDARWSRRGEWTAAAAYVLSGAYLLDVLFADEGKATLSSGNAVVGLVLVGVCNLVLALNTWSRRELWDSDRELMPKWVALMNGRAALNYQLAAAVFLFGLAIVLA